jgi:hypothetical protein
MNCRRQNRPSPCPLHCKPTNPLISSSGLIEIHCTYLTITKPTASQKLYLIYKSFAVLSAPLYWWHPCITMNSLHVRMLGVHSKTRKMITFVLFSPCIVSDHKLLVQTNAHIKYIYLYITSSGCYMFRLVAILSELTTNTKTDRYAHSNTQKHTQQSAGAPQSSKT